jgi:hypothetical protein
MRISNLKLFLPILGQKLYRIFLKIRRNYVFSVPLYDENETAETDSEAS